MPEEIPFSKKVRREVYNAIIGSYRTRMTALQRDARSLGMTCVIVVEGAADAARSILISRITAGLDPLDTRVYADSAPKRKDRLYPEMRRYWLRLPARGAIAIYNRGWYREPGSAGQGVEENISSLERQASRGGPVIKLMLRMPRKSINKANRAACLKPLSGKQYKKVLRAQDSLLKEHAAGIPWILLAAKNMRSAEIFAYEAILSALGGATARVKAGLEASEISAGAEDPAAEMPLARMEPGINLSKKAYHRRIKKVRARLHALAGKMAGKRIPLVIAAEAVDRDSAEQCIRFLARAFDKKAARVIGDGDFTEEDSLYPIPRRYYRLLPAGGKTALFARSWYRQALDGDESPAGTCGRGDITALESQITRKGILVKLWLQATAAETETETETGHIAGCPACEDTLLGTDTAWAPWTIIDAGNKRYARAAALEAVIAAMAAGIRQKR
jgi:AMP-polyphosphate phosphotransferase